MELANIPAYVITNEDLRWQINALRDRPQQDILTVAASGDQAMFYHLAGAKHIDTFDITQNAGIIQQIKYIAIKLLSRDEYIDMLNELHKPGNIFQKKYAALILPHLSHEMINELKTSEAIDWAFTAGGSPRTYPQNLPDANEYAKLHQTVKSTPNFIHTPLLDLHTQVSAQYDIINISNIFDFCDSHAQTKILNNLGKNLKVGGRIVYPAQMPRYKYNGIRLANPQTKTVVEHEQTIADKHNNLIIFQRTR